MCEAVHLVRMTFRNVEGSASDDVREWPFEGLAEVLERGLIGDWRPVLDELRQRPWGDVARRVERWIELSSDEPAAAFFRLAIDRVRHRAQERERALVAGRVRRAIEASGLTAAEFATQVGTSASRLSTYARGQVMPSAAMLLRIEALARLIGDLADSDVDD